MILVKCLIFIVTINRTYMVQLILAWSFAGLQIRLSFNSTKVRLIERHKEHNFHFDKGFNSTKN